MIDIYNFEDLSSDRMQAVAKTVSDYTVSARGQEHGIAPIGFKEVLQNRLALVAFICDAYAGYIRAKEAITKDSTDSAYQQIGTLVVSAVFENNGVGSQLVEKMTEEVLGKGNIPYAFCNTESKPLFVRVGYEEALPGELPANATSLYSNLPMVNLPTKVL